MHTMKELLAEHKLTAEQLPSEIRDYFTTPCFQDTPIRGFPRRQKEHFLSIITEPVMNRAQPNIKLFLESFVVEIKKGNTPKPLVVDAPVLLLKTLHKLIYSN